MAKADMGFEKTSGGSSCAEQDRRHWRR